MFSSLPSVARKEFLKLTKTVQKCYSYALIKIIMPNALNKRQAVEFLGIDEKIFDNYFKYADELHPLPRTGKGAFKFNDDELEQWKENRRWRTVELTFEDYSKCLDFALAQHFRGYVTSDWGTARTREFGQKLTNWIKGQLAEVAVKKFFEKEFQIKVKLDFGIHENIVPQDIIGIEENGVEREPQIGIGIKSSKPKSAFLILGEKEVELEDRRSDVYILGRPDIPDDHLLRITREKIIEIVEGQQHFSLYEQDIPEFKNIPCEIAGWCNVQDLVKVDAKTVHGLEEATGFRYIKKSGQLNRSKESWQELLNRV